MLIFFYIYSQKKTKQHKDTGINSASTYISKNRVSSTELLSIHVDAAESRICPIA